MPEAQDDWKNEVRALWLRVFLALNKAAALGVMIVVHKAVDEGALWIVGQHAGEYYLTVLRAIFYSAFAIVYVHLSWEMVRIFVPKLASRRLQEKRDDQSDEIGNVRE